MPLTPIEIENHKFETRMRGYDRAEVSAFLSAIAEDSAALVAQKNLLEEERMELKRQLERAAEREKRVQETILAVRDLGEKMKDDARRESELIVREARFMASKILDDARGQALEIEAQISQMRIERDTFDDRLRMLLDEHQRLLIQRRHEADPSVQHPPRKKWAAPSEVKDIVEVAEQ
jgi:cell division initiation protein